jgi:acetyl-CoA carboxylase biotin carboxyl carrier protein
MPKTEIDSDAVRQLAALLEETGLTEIEYAQGEWRVRVVRAPNGLAAHVVPPAAAEVRPTAEAAAAEHPGVVRSPMVGTVYLAREPGGTPFVRPGATVSEGDTLLLIEAMKTYNEVRAPRGGRITRILVADGAPVEYGEPLLILE